MGPSVSNTGKNRACSASQKFTYSTWQIRTVSWILVRSPNSKKLDLSSTGRIFYLFMRQFKRKLLVCACTIFCMPCQQRLRAISMSQLLKYERTNERASSGSRLVTVGVYSWCRCCVARESYTVWWSYVGRIVQLFTNTDFPGGKDAEKLCLYALACIYFCKIAPLHIRRNEVAQR